MLWKLFQSQNPRWPTNMWYGTPNFFPMGDKSKILFSSMGFSGTGSAMKLYSKLYARYFDWIRRFCHFRRFLSTCHNIFVHMPLSPRCLYKLPCVELHAIWWLNVLNCARHILFEFGGFFPNFLRFSSIFIYLYDGGRRYQVVHLTFLS